MNDFKHRLRAFVPSGRQPVRAEIPSTDLGENVAVIRVYDAIDGWGGDWGISAKEFTVALDGLPDTVNEIRLHINSPGGDVFDGIAILNALRAHDAKVVAVVDGLAASAASVLAVGADETVMARNSELMIHDAWGICIGNAAEMKTMADELDHLSDNIASIYADKSGSDIAVWRAAMEKESWYSAEEAVAAGLADRVDTGKKTAPKNQFDLSVFNYAGRAAAPAPNEQAPPVVEPESSEIDALSAARFRLLVASTRT